MTLAFGAKKSSEQIFTENETVDLTKASYTEDLSHTGLDEETTTFTVSVDRIHFRKPAEIVTMVLEANGFANNFENLLSCFDTLVHSVRVRAGDKGKSEIPQARNFVPCLSFQLPAKNRVGPLLKKFYAEIEGYELELARLRAGELDEAGGKKQTREQLKREVERLQIENARLQGQVQQLTEQLAMAMRSQAHVTRALESNNIIPPQLRPMLVREVSLQERTVTLKAGRSSYVVPLLLLRALPKVGDPCLLNVKDEKVIDAYFYETPGREFEREMAEVLHVEEKTCKLRDSHRRIHYWTVKHEQEDQLFQQLQRGTKVILSRIDEVVVRLSVVIDQDAALWNSFVQDRQTIFQLEQARQADPKSLPIFDGKD